MKVPPFKRRSDGLESEALIILKPSKSTFRPFGIFPISKLCPFRRFLHTLVVLKTQNANDNDSDSLKVGTIFHGLARSGPNQIKLRKKFTNFSFFSNCLKSRLTELISRWQIFWRYWKRWNTNKIHSSTIKKVQLISECNSWSFFYNFLTDQILLSVKSNSSLPHY